MKESKIILAADKMTMTDLVALVGTIGSRLYAVKVHDLVDSVGSSIIMELREAGARRVWVDYKLHDIPETMRGRAAALARHGANILTVHASAGVDAMRKAKAGAPLAQIYAVTMLTSLEEAEISRIANRSREEQVMMLALMAKEAGMDGIVCSPVELKLLNELKDFRDSSMEFVTPGIRSAGKEVHDQKRVGTPRQAIHDGATKLVIGRQLTEASDPVAALEEIEAEIADLL